jgi:VIT1/CCC1 family predicted Fe2+/Mn2+ transporter
VNTTCQAVSSSPWANAAVIATLLGALAFVVLYAASTRGAWRRSATGLNVMALIASILAVSALAIAGIIWGTDWPHRDVIRTAAWGLIAACIWWRVVILWRVQHRP